MTTLTLPAPTLTDPAPVAADDELGPGPRDRAEPCALCDLGPDGPCPACDGTGWFEPAHPAVA